MYQLHEVTNGSQFEGIEISIGEQKVVRLIGGQALLISTQVAALNQRDPDGHRTQEYLNGIVTGILHCAMTGAVPSVAMI